MDPKESIDPKREADQSNPAEDSVKKCERTAEEQMAAFEEDLKQTDWGHQPC
jgi:hypothetical protein